MCDVFAFVLSLHDKVNKKKYIDKRLFPGTASFFFQIFIQSFLII